MAAPASVGLPSTVSPSVITRTESLFVATSPIHGAGVFAARAIGVGELVECCPTIVCPPGQEQLLEQTALRGLYFTWEDDAIAVALGFGSLYNHAWEPNAQYELDHDQKVVRFLAVRMIAEGEEITVNYTGEPDGRGDLWFEPSG
ncbi:MAG: SET domain-containing protein [Actinomycetota bacterium]|nr:SET domain-containing protein [Actinomycetota bacterium]MDQ3574377.1 SET domain-containing protein [Actinomycetota bacterium]